MATFNYQEMVSLAKSLIVEFGTVCTLKKIDATPRNPMRPEQGQTSQRFCEVLENVQAVFADNSILSSQIVSEDLVKSVDRIAIISPIDDTLDRMDILETEEKQYAIAWMKKLKPAETVLLYIAGLKT